MSDNLLQIHPEDSYVGLGFDSYYIMKLSIIVTLQLNG